MSIVEKNIARVSKKITDVAVTSDHVIAIVDAGNSLAEAREALRTGDVQRAAELVILAEEQIDCAGREPD